MTTTHDETSGLTALLSDAEDPDSPSVRNTPDSVQTSALDELRRRGLSPYEIMQVRIGNYKAGVDY